MGMRKTLELVDRQFRQIFVEYCDIRDIHVEVREGQIAVRVEGGPGSSSSGTGGTRAGKVCNIAGKLFFGKKTSIWIGFARAIEGSEYSYASHRCQSQSSQCGGRMVAGNGEDD